MRRVAAPRLKTNLAILVAGDAAREAHQRRRVRAARADPRARRATASSSSSWPSIFVGALIVEAGLGPVGRARRRARGRGRRPGSSGRILALRAHDPRRRPACLLGAVAATLGAAGRRRPRALLLLAAGLMLVPKAALCEWLFQGRNEMAVGDARPRSSSRSSRWPERCSSCTSRGDLVRVPFILAAAIADRRGRAAGARAPARSPARPPSRSRRRGPTAARVAAARPEHARVGRPVLLADDRGRAVRAGPAAGAFGAAHRLTVSMHAVVWLYFFNLLPPWSRLGSEDGGGLEPAVRRSLGVTVGARGLPGRGGRPLLAPSVIEAALRRRVRGLGAGLLAHPRRSSRRSPGSAATSGSG